MPSVNLFDDSLKLIIQPSDRRTHLMLSQIGFCEVALVPQLLYCEVGDRSVADLFEQLSEQVSEKALSNSRYIVTQASIQSKSILVEFLNVQPLTKATRLLKHAWFFQVLAQQQLFFHYQPIFSLRSREVVGHECLARAVDNQGQRFGGQQLIDAALTMDLTREFDEQARIACLNALPKWCLAATNQHRFFINVLPNAIAQNPRSIEQNFQQVLELGLRPEQIVFELTEIEALDHHPHLPQLIHQIREWGFGLALDDLGSNVALDHYCMEFQPDVIKLDRRLIQGCSRYALKQVMIKSLLQTAHESGIVVLAEGLTAREDIEFCTEIGVDLGQGFGLGAPSVTPWQEVAQFEQCCLKVC